jgi:hypothetical protein
MNWARMPETAVHKDGKAFRWKDKVRVSKNLASATPPDDRVRAENLDQAHFRGSITAALNPRHNLGALCNRKHIWHMGLIQRRSFG